MNGMPEHALTHHGGIRRWPGGGMQQFVSAFGVQAKHTQPTEKRGQHIET